MLHISGRVQKYLKNMGESKWVLMQRSEYKFLGQNHITA